MVHSQSSQSKKGMKAKAKSEQVCVYCILYLKMDEWQQFYYKFVFYYIGEGTGIYKYRELQGTMHAVAIACCYCCEQVHSTHQYTEYARKGKRMRGKNSLGFFHFTCSFWEGNRFGLKEKELNETCSVDSQKSVFPHPSPQFILFYFVFWGSSCIHSISCV